jgi:hypothetical protein
MNIADDVIVELSTGMVKKIAVYENKYDNNDA